MVLCLRKRELLCGSCASVGEERAARWSRASRRRESCAACASVVKRDCSWPPCLRGEERAALWSLCLCGVPIPVSSVAIESAHKPLHRIRRGLGTA